MRIFRETLEGGARLDCILHEQGETLRPALIICPGGGYAYISPREAEPPAASFWSMGFQVFVLQYRTGEEAADKRALEDLARAVLFVREHGEQIKVNTAHVAVLGFSAGGHLAACLGVHWDDTDLAARTGARKEQLRPDALALCYPVITAGEYTNEPTITTVDAKGPGRDYWSVERHVTSGMPPVFLWHTMDDELVPVENSLIMAWALHRAGVSCECHLYETGPHGLSVCTEEVGSPAPDVKNWVTLCGRWFARHFGGLSEM